MGVKLVSKFQTWENQVNGKLEHSHFLENKRFLVFTKKSTFSRYSYSELFKNIFSHLKLKFDIFRSLGANTHFFHSHQNN